MSASCMASCSDAVAVEQCSCSHQTVWAASVSVLMYSSSSRSAFLSNSSLWKYWSMTSRTSVGSTQKFLGMMDVLMSPRGCRKPWPLVGNLEAYCPWASGLYYICTKHLVGRIKVGIRRQMSTMRSPAITLISRHLNIFYQTCFASLS